MALTQHKKNWHRKTNGRTEKNHSLANLKNNSIDGQNFVPRGKTDTIVANEIGIRQGNNQHTTNGLTQHKKNWQKKMRIRRMQILKCKKIL